MISTQVHKNKTIADAVMQGFSDGALPISTALASEFAVFDRWYTSFPGPSWPNHMFSYSATAAGATNTGDGYLEVSVAGVGGTGRRR